MRKYEFDLPVKLASFKASFIPGMLQSAGIWDELPEDLVDKINEAVKNFADLEITKEDLDEIDDDTYHRLHELIEPYV